jgi:thiamine kinase-like enzyme
VAGCSLQDAELAIRHVAKLHAEWWASPKLDDMSWLPDLDVVYDPQAFQDLYLQMWQPFLKKVGHHLPEMIREIGARYGRSFIEVSTHLFITAPRTLVHWDYQLDNLFFASSEGGTRLTVIDWQLVTRGRGVTDVAYFLGQNVSPKDRRTNEMHILRMYYATLVENGVQGYSFEQCLRDYRLAMLFWLYAMVITVGGGWFTEEQEAAIVDVLLPRASAAVLDLNAGELLPG